MRISVVIPVLNGEAFLAQAIRAVRNQTLPPAEIIVADNGSTDASIEIARRFGPPVRVMSVPERGATAARIAGYGQTTGDALMFLDADDLIAPDTLRHLASALSVQTGAMACCPWRRYERVGECWRARPASSVPRRPGHDDLAAWLTGWYHPPCSILWSRTAYEAAGGWNPETTINQDGDLVMRALVAGVPLLRASGGLGYYRRLPDGKLSLSAHGESARGLEGRLRVLEGIETRLRDAGRVQAYAAPLAEAYQMIASGCVGDAMAAIRDRAQEGLDRNGGFGAWRTARRTLGRQAGTILRSNMPEKQTAKPGLVAAGSAAKAAFSGNAPLVSVILPTYNRAATLDRAISSVLAQSYGNFELLVIDDGSSDATPAVVGQHSDNRVRYLRQDRNRGVAAARNRGLHGARGDLIAFLDSDDAWMPAKLERQVAQMGRAPAHIGLLYSGLCIRHPSGRVETWTPTARGHVLAEILRHNVVHFGTSSTMIRAEVAETVGGFDTTMPANEDHDYWTRVAHFYDFDFDPEPLAIYDQGDTVSEGAAPKRSLHFQRNMRARDLFVEQHGYESGRLDAIFAFQMDSARRHLEWDEGNVWAGRKLLLKSARAAPAKPLPYVWLALSLLPKGPRARMTATLRHLQQRRARGHYPRPKHET